MKYVYLLIVLSLATTADAACNKTYQFVGSTTYSWCMMPCMPPHPDTVNVRIEIPSAGYDQTFNGLDNSDYRWIVNITPQNCFTDLAQVNVYVTDSEFAKAYPRPYVTAICGILNRNTDTLCPHFVEGTIQNDPIPSTTTTTRLCDTYPIYIDSTVHSGEDLNAILYLSCNPLTELQNRWRTTWGAWQDGGTSAAVRGIVNATMTNTPDTDGTYDYWPYAEFVSYTPTTSYRFRVSGMPTTTTLPYQECYLLPNNVTVPPVRVGEAGSGFKMVSGCMESTSGVHCFELEREFEDGTMQSQIMHCCSSCPTNGDGMLFEKEGWYRYSGKLQISDNNNKIIYVNLSYPAYIYAYASTPPTVYPDPPSEWNADIEYPPSTTTTTTVIPCTDCVIWTDRDYLDPIPVGDFNASFEAHTNCGSNCGALAWSYETMHESLMFQDGRGLYCEACSYMDRGLAYGETYHRSGWYRIQGELGIHITSQFGSGIREIRTPTYSYIYAYNPLDPPANLDIPDPPGWWTNPPVPLDYTLPPNVTTSTTTTSTTISTTSTTSTTATTTTTIYTPPPPCELCLITPQHYNNITKQVGQRGTGAAFSINCESCGRDMTRTYVQYETGTVASAAGNSCGWCGWVDEWAFTMTEEGWYRTSATSYMANGTELNSSGEYMYTYAYEDELPIELPPIPLEFGPEVTTTTSTSTSTTSTTINGTSTTTIPTTTSSSTTTLKPTTTTSKPTTTTTSSPRAPVTTTTMHPTGYSGAGKTVGWALLTMLILVPLFAILKLIANDNGK